MDPTIPTVPADRLRRIEAILERARRLDGPEVIALIGAYRGDCAPGSGEADLADTPRTRARAVAAATAHAGLRREASALAAAASSAVRSAPGVQGHERRLASLGLLYDAELAVADAGLAILLEDHIAAATATTLARPFSVATGRSVPDPKEARR